MEIKKKPLRLPRPGIVRVAVSPIPNNRAVCWCGGPAPRGIVVWTNGELFRVCDRCFRKGVVKAGRLKRLGGDVQELGSGSKFCLRPGAKYKMIVFRFAASWRIVSEPRTNRGEKMQSSLQVQTYGQRAKLIEVSGFIRPRLWQAAALQLKRHYDSVGWPVDKLGGWTKKKRFWSPLLNDGYGGYQEEPDRVTLEAAISTAKRRNRRRYWNPETNKFQVEPWLDDAACLTDANGMELDSGPAYWWSVPDDGNTLVEGVENEDEGGTQEEN